jgi:predicted DNA-binding transcriptional regulator YafY
VINIGRIISCAPFAGDFRGYSKKPHPAPDRSVTISLYDGRNTLERVMLHFAHFEKEARRIDDRHYVIKIKYNKDDETEMVVRVLSFGPFIRVTEPEDFVELIKKRLEMQRSCGLV